MRQRRRQNWAAHTGTDMRLLVGAERFYAISISYDSEVSRRVERTLRSGHTAALRASVHAKLGSMSEVIACSNPTSGNEIRRSVRSDGHLRTVSGACLGAHNRNALSHAKNTLRASYLAVGARSTPRRHGQEVSETFQEPWSAAGILPARPIGGKHCRQDAGSTLAAPPDQLKVHGPNAPHKSHGGFPGVTALQRLRRCR